MTRLFKSLFGAKASKTIQTRSRLGLEVLEDRQLLAVNVIFNSALGQLEISGNAAHDSVSVSARGSSALVASSELDLAGNVVPHTARLNILGLTGVQRILFSGNDGNDQFYNNTSLPCRASGGNGADKLVGGDTADILDGGESDDQLDGRAGNDTLKGGAGMDALEGNTGDDTLEGGRDDDILRGWMGNDTYRFAGANLGTDTIYEYDGLGIDTLDFTSADFAVTVDLGTVARQDMGAGIASGPKLSLNLISGLGIENVRGSAFDDGITGNELANQLEGLGGRDRLDGRAGNDILLGGADSDTYVFGPMAAGNYLIDELSNQSKDTLDFSGHLWGVSIDLARTGTQTVNSFVNLTLTSTTGIENVLGTKERDLLRGNSRDNFLSGLGGNDRLFGRAGSDELRGGEGDDDLFGGGASNYYGDPGDRLFGENGQDVLIGGGELWGGKNMDFFANTSGGWGKDAQFIDCWHGQVFLAVDDNQLLPPPGWENRIRAWPE